jgi:hypothetical protein
MGLAELAEQVSSKMTAPTWPLAAKHATCASLRLSPSHNTPPTMDMLVLVYLCVALHANNELMILAIMMIA